MRGRTYVAALAAGLLFALPASAARLRDLQRPSPCDHVIPTGLPLPRQAVADGTVNGAIVLAVPNPSYRDKPIGLVGKDEPMTVLQECGMKLRIRNVRGLEGWIPTPMSRGEQKAYDKAANRTPETEHDCELLYLDPVVIDRCKIKLGAERAHAEEIKNSVYLQGEELSRYLGGRTLTLTPNGPDSDAAAKQQVAFFSRDGELFLMSGNASVLRYRTRYALSGDTISFAGGYVPDARLRKRGDQILWSTTGGFEFKVAVSEGDSAGTVAEVSKWNPKAAAPEAPKGAEEVAGPSLGR